MVRTPVKKEETPKAVLDFIEARLYDTELALEEAEGKPHNSTEVDRLNRDVEFLSSLQSGAQKFGSLTPKQEMAVRRMMRRNANAPMPSVGQRIIVEGEVDSVKGKYAPTFDKLGQEILLTFTLFDDQNREVVFHVGESTHLFTRLVKEEGLVYTVDDDGETVQIDEYPDRLQIRGTVKLVSPGRIRLRRPAIPSKK